MKDCDDDDVDVSSLSKDQCLRLFGTKRNNDDTKKSLCEGLKQNDRIVAVELAQGAAKDLQHLCILGQVMRSYSSIRMLDLGNNALSVKDIESLAQGLMLAPNVTRLYVYETGLTELGARALAKVTSIKRLVAWSNNVSDAGCAELLNAAHFEELDISGNPFSNETAEAIAQAFTRPKTQMKSLTLLMNGSEFSRRAHSRVVRALRNCTTLECFLVGQVPRSTLRSYLCAYLMSGAPLIEFDILPDGVSPISSRRYAFDSLPVRPSRHHPESWLSRATFPQFVKYSPGQVALLRAWQAAHDRGDPIMDIPQAVLSAGPLYINRHFESVCVVLAMLMAMATSEMQACPVRDFLFRDGDRRIMCVVWSCLSG